MDEEKSVLRWGGLAGILGGILLVAVFVIVGVFVVPDPAEPEGLVMRFPDVRAAHTVEEVLYLGVLALWAIHFLALYRALRGTSLAPALFGSTLGIMGLGVLAAGALPQVARTPISDLYHAPGATPEDRATLVLLWQATQGIFDALLVVGLLLLPIGVIALGVAMLGAPAFGKGVGGVGVVIGVLGVAAGVVLLIDPGSPIAIVSVLSLIVFHIALGWKVYSLSRAPQGVFYSRQHHQRYNDRERRGNFKPPSYGNEWFAEDEGYQVIAEKRNEGLLVKAYPLEQAERISRSMVEVRVVDGALLLDADPAQAGAINTVSVKPKPPAPPVTIAEALVRSIRTPNRLILEAGAVARR